MAFEHALSGHAMCERAQTPVTASGQTAKMSDAWLRRLVMLATVLLVLHAVGSWAYAALGVPAAIVSAGLVGAVSIFSARMAGLGEGNSAWFVVPTMVFTVLPLGARLWTLVTTEQGWWARSIEFAPFLIGFAAPVLLLLTAYLELGRRERGGEPSAIANTAADATRVSPPDAARIPFRQSL